MANNFIVLSQLESKDTELVDTLVAISIVTKKLATRVKLKRKKEENPSERIKGLIIYR